MFLSHLSYCIITHYSDVRLFIHDIDGVKAHEVHDPRYFQKMCLFREKKSTRDNSIQEEKP